LSIFEEQLSNSGIVLELEKKIILSSSLEILRIKQNASKIFFIGAVKCLYADYFLAMSCDGFDDEGSRRFFYSNNASDWMLLQLPDAAHQEYALRISSRFSGDPNHRYEIPRSELISNSDENGKRTNADSESQTDLPDFIQLSEEERLASVMVQIINETWLKSSKSNSKNRVFTLKGTEISENTPEWAIRGKGHQTSDVKTFTWRSLVWPGAVFVQKGQQQANLYWGSGEKNIDLPFMI